MAIAASDRKAIQLSCKRLSHVVLAMCSLATGYAGLELADGHPVKAVIFVTLMGLMPWSAARLLPSISMARAAGRPVAAFGLSVVFAGALAAEWIGETMVFAGQRQTTSINASLQNARLDGARSKVRELEAKHKVLQAKLEEQAPHGPSAAYDSQIKDAETKMTLESSKQRGGCRSKCDEARALAANLRAKQAIAADREMNTEPQLRETIEALNEARLVADSTSAGNSIADASSGLFAMISTGSLNPHVDSKLWASVWLGMFFATVLSILGIGLYFAGVTDWDAPRVVRQRQPSRFRHFFGKLRAWLNGETYVPPPEAPVNSTVTNVTVVGDGLAKDIVSAINQARSKIAPKMAA